MSSDLIRVRNLTVRFGDRTILDKVDADIVRGKITSLMGLNGSGKTTLLKAILREVPYSGTVEFRCGHDHSRPAPQHVGYVPQQLSIDANLPLTVRDLLALSLQKRPLFFGVRSATEKTMQQMLTNIGAQPMLLDSLVEKLSGGERQRVLLALALQPRPELLLLDEPAAGIDFRDVEGFYHFIERINKETGVTILLVSHDLSVVTSHTNHVLCLRDGRIQCQGPPREILNGERLKEIFGTDISVFAHQH